MKILIVGFAKIKYMPYMHFYLENMDRVSNDVHLLYWNRDLQEEDVSSLHDVTLHEFRCKQNDDVSKWSKIGSFVGFRKYAKQVIAHGNYDFIVVLHSLPGVLLRDALCKRYKNKYILDYRDSTYEGFAPFKKIVGDLVRCSAATFVSSDAFRRFLPGDCREKIFTSHNLLMDSLSHRDEKEKHGSPSETIRIAFWGFIRHREINCELIKKIAADPRFALHYYGREQQIAWQLKEYAQELGAKNVFFHGEYKPEDRYEFVRNTDIIHNVYHDANMMLAMGNKYYDAAIFYLPLMSMEGSFMASAAEKAGIGFTVDPHDDDFTDKLFALYSNMDQSAFNKNCDRELQRVLLEYNAGADRIKQLTEAIRKE